MCWSSAALRKSLLGGDRRRVVARPDASHRPGPTTSRHRCHRQRLGRRTGRRLRPSLGGRDGYGEARISARSWHVAPQVSQISMAWCTLIRASASRAVTEVPRPGVQVHLGPTDTVASSLSTSPGTAMAWRGGPTPFEGPGLAPQDRSCAHRPHRPLATATFIGSINAHWASDKSLRYGSLSMPRISTWTCPKDGPHGDQYHDRAITNRRRSDLTPTDVLMSCQTCRWSDTAWWWGDLTCPVSNGLRSPRTSRACPDG